ncbi:MAG: DUF389 domain-containing protein [Flavobacterium sp.]|nr:DUF389 domain-containing protein [Flavobacterium sp.]
MKRILEYLNLESELDDFDIIHDKVEKDISFKGTNLWILVFAIFVASIGLNMNSTAVIIGAMLISPLMGPINGMGYSVATYDFPLFKTALKNFSFAVLASLIASTLYFTISPVSAAHSELLARTSPTIYDVLIAFFGGLAGIVAISSKQKGNVLPGVAIATALMPPLCTAGYGLATEQYSFFWGAFYLFTINTVFIALASTLVCQLLKFPIRASIDEKKKRNVNHILSLIILITVVPSIYFGYGLVQNERFTENSKKFIESISVFEGNYLLKSKIDAPKKVLTLGFAGSELNQQYKSKIYKKANDFGIDSTNITFQKALTFSKESDLTNSVNLEGEVKRLQSFIEAQKTKNDSLNTVGNQLLKEINSLYPELKSCAFAVAKNYSVQDSITPVTLLSFTSTRKFNDSENQKLKNWLSSRLNTKNIKILIEEEEKK